MISQTTLLILGGCLLGAIQLIVGVAIGIWLRRSDAADVGHDRHDMLQAGLIAERLRELADDMSSSAHEHRSRLDQASQLLTSDCNRTDESLAELVVDVIDDIVRANQNLQSQLETAEHRLEQQAVEIEAHISRSLTDPLTGLPNRREFNDRLEERMSAWKRRQEMFSLLLLDVDHFKQLNDEHGHLVGDQVLAAIGRTLRGAVRREDAVARYGGEEFAILLPNTSLEQAGHVAEKICDAVAAGTVDYNGQKVAVTVSGGLAEIAPPDTADSIIQRADAALYAAKASGRNRTCTHDGSETCLPVGPAGRLVELIHSADPESYSADASTANQPIDVGTYLERDVISAELAQTCEELRRCVAERGQREPDAAPVARS
ncbi:MAG: GGDEF domain-containing protein [Planctomycetes bacterium]|nr:GGDEF domain-containing protein [Planctomycetota bacterium]